jgi:hypothetical protein
MYRIQSFKLRSLPAPDNWTCHELILVDQAQPRERRYNAATTKYRHVLAGLLFQFQDLFCHIFFDQPGIVPFDLIKGPRKDDLRYIVQHGGQDWTFLIRGGSGPVRRKKLIRHPSHQTSVLGLQLLGSIFCQLVIPDKPV